MMGVVAGKAVTDPLWNLPSLPLAAYDLTSIRLLFTGKRQDSRFPCRSHPGEDGATHQPMEDLALARALPHMTVVNPCDYNQTRLATLAAAGWDGPLYLRFGRPSVPNFTPVDVPFQIGKAWMVQPGEDVTILATGHLVWEALEAVKILAQKGIRAELINIHTLKPLDEKAILDSARKTGAVVTAEEHLIAGGLGELTAGLLARYFPVPMRMVAMEEGFGQSGTPRELMDLYGLNAAGIVNKVCEGPATGHPETAGQTAPCFQHALL